jgi:hypothetical protein
LSTEPDRGTSLERLGETSPGVPIPDRAGAIVSEFVSSIMQEAQAQGTASLEAAEQAAAEQRRAAEEAVGALRQHVERLSGELSMLLESLRREASVLAADASLARGEATPELREPLSEEEALAAVREGLERSEPGPERVDEAEAVPEADERAEEPEVTAGETAEGVAEPEEAVEPEEGPAEVEEAAEPEEAVEPEEGPAEVEEGATAHAPSSPEEEAFARIAQLTDDDLARTYSNVVGAARAEHQDTERVEYLTRLHAAVVEEALGRPAFAYEEEAETSLRRLSPWRKRREALFADLRAACRQAAWERGAVEPPSPSGRG